MLPSRLCWKTPQTGPGPLSPLLPAASTSPARPSTGTSPIRSPGSRRKQPARRPSPAPATPIRTSRPFARLRAEKENLTRHLYIYEDHIRRLTLENEALRVALQAHSGVTLISPRTGDTVPGRP